MEKKKEQAKVLSQEMLADGIYSLWIETEAARTARPGQFVSVYTADASKLLPRPISICEIDKEGKKLRLSALSFTSLSSSALFWIAVPDASGTFSRYVQPDADSVLLECALLPDHPLYISAYSTFLPLSSMVGEMTSRQSTS